MRNLVLGLACISCIGYGLTVDADVRTPEGQARTSPDFEPELSDRQTDRLRALGSYLLSVHPATVRRVGHEKLGLTRSLRAPDAVNVFDRLFGIVAPTKDERTLGDFSVRDIDGKKVDLKEYLGNVVLITNVASR